jgi:hypothetical protein
MSLMHFMKLYTKYSLSKLVMQFQISCCGIFLYIYWLFVLGEFLKSDSCSKIITTRINLLFRPSFYGYHIVFHKKCEIKSMPDYKDMSRHFTKELVNNREMEG